MKHVLVSRSRPLNDSDATSSVLRLCVFIKFLWTSASKAMVLDGISWFILDCECLEEDSMCLQCLSCFCIFQNFRDLTWIIMDSPSVHRPYFFFSPPRHRISSMKGGGLLGSAKWSSTAWVKTVCTSTAKSQPKEDETTYIYIPHRIQVCYIW